MALGDGQADILSVLAPIARIELIEGQGKEFLVSVLVEVEQIEITISVVIRVKSHNDIISRTGRDMSDHRHRRW